MVFWVSLPLLAYNRQWEEQLIEAPPCHCICMGMQGRDPFEDGVPRFPSPSSLQQIMRGAIDWSSSLSVVFKDSYIREGYILTGTFCLFLSSIGPGLGYSLPLSCNSCCLAQLGGAPSSHPHPLQKNICYDQTPQPSKGKGTIEFQKRISVKLTCHL